MMDDLISRQDAIDAMEHAKEQYFDRKVIIGKMQDVVRNLPSARPDVGLKEGYWIYLDNDELRYDSYRCSNCNRSITVDAERKDDIGFIIEDMRYCPNCGADMRGEEDG